MQLKNIFLKNENDLVSIIAKGLTQLEYTKKTTCLFFCILYITNEIHLRHRFSIIEMNEIRIFHFNNV